MCVILLQIHEKLMFYFCELYHEIIKQEIFLKSNETQQGGGVTKRASSYIYHPINLHGGDFWFVYLYNKSKNYF